MKKNVCNATLCLLLLAGCVQVAQADTVTCERPLSPCNQDGLRDYYYDVTIGAGSSLSTLVVGTLDGNINDYSNWVMPTGWAYELVTNSDPALLYDIPYTNHGVGTENDGMVPYKIVWSGPAQTTATTYSFGFDNAQAPTDVGWAIDYAATNWSALVSDGAGPVHAPVPEPSTLALLLAAGFGLLAHAWQKRK